MLPPQIDGDLTEDERAGLLLAHKRLVETGIAQWEVETDEA